MNTSTIATGQNTFMEALKAEGPSPEIDKDKNIYGFLIGSWQAEVVDYKSDGSRYLNKGEWHFSWVLEGRAIQDVWISPPRTDRPGKPGQPNRYGTTIRVYDPRIEAWQITWFNPVSQAFSQLIGKRVGDTILQEGRFEDGSLMRWIFSEITTQSCHWRGERSVNGGKTWNLDVEFFLKRL